MTAFFAKLENTGMSKQWPGAKHMLAKRIIPCLDVKEGRVVKGRSFGNLVNAGDPVECAAEYCRQGADELVFLDITATLEARKTIKGLIERVAEKISIPLTVGGGISTLEHIGRLLNAGADKVSINSAAVRHPELIRSASQAYGAQCVVVAIDAKEAGGVWQVYLDSGNTPSGLDALQWAVEAEALGAGEILLTSIDSDGHQCGYNNELTAALAERVNVPVVASGGAGNPENILSVLTEGKADAALAASIFHYKKYSVSHIKEHLRREGVSVRLD